jgi:hypothetical protein
MRQVDLIVARLLRRRASGGPPQPAAGAPGQRRAREPRAVGRLGPPDRWLRTEPDQHVSTVGTGNSVSDVSRAYEFLEWLVVS